MASAGVINRNYNSTDTTHQGLTDTTLPQPPASWEREGYFFKEWNTSSDGSGTSCQPGDSIPFSGEVYAIWYGDYIEAVKDSSGIEHPIKDIISGYITSASVPSASSTTPKMDGTAAVGTETAFARGDHVHPTDTSRASLDIVAPEWEPNVDYWEWDSVIYQGQLYFCREAHVSSSTWDSSKWTPITVGGLAYILMSEKIDDPSTKTSGQFLKYNGTTWVAGDVPEGSVASSTTPKMDGTASTGSENAFARGDHIHPTDTSRQAKITASGILKGNGSGTVTAATAGTDYQAPITFDGTYNASTNKAATVSTVTNAINALDGGTIGTGSTTKTITSLSQSNGNVSATFNDIAFPVTSVNGQTGAVTVTEGLEPLIGTTADITPTQVLNAINEGRAVKISHTHATYGVITASYFNYSAAVGAIVSNVIVNFGSSLALSLVGTIQGNVWDVSTILIPSSPDDIGAQPYIYADGILKGDGNGTITAATAGTDYQAPLVSGTNIKTINNESILGSGNISISAGSSDVFIAEYGVTTYADILAAYEAGKAIFCQKIASSSLNNTKIVSILPLAYIGSSDQTASASRKAIFKNMSGNYSLNQTNITSWTVSGVSGQWSSENIETDTSDQGILSINKSGNSTYLYSNTVNGIVKDDGTGVLSAAVAGTDYQAPLVSGTNIKTINNESLLGSGNIDISGGVGALNSTSKLYLVGAENQQSSVTSYSNSNVYATNGVLNAKSFSVDASANIIYNSSSKSIDFTFV